VDNKLKASRKFNVEVLEMRLLVWLIPAIASYAGFLLWLGWSHEHEGWSSEDIVALGLGGLIASAGWPISLLFIAGRLARKKREFWSKILVKLGS
jgi:hypothetical protein